MCSHDVTLSVLLWAVSWGIKELNTNPLVIFERTGLLVSDKLPEILKNWFKPRQWHSAGIHTEAGHGQLAKWAFYAVSCSIETEMRTLKPLLQLPDSKLTNDLAEIDLGNLMDKISTVAPVCWKLLQHTTKPSAQSDIKNPNPVHTPSLILYVLMNHA